MDFFKERNSLKNLNDHKIKEPSTFAICLAEIIGTGLLLFMGCLGCVSYVDPMPLPHHLSSVAFGLTIVAIIQLFGHISGAHLNPQVSLASVIFGEMKSTLLPFYVGSQFFGAVLGFGLLRILLPEEYVATEYFDTISNKTLHRTGICSTVPHEKISLIQALGFEIIMTCVLILICGAVWDKRNKSKEDSTPLRFGLIIVAIGMVAGPYTGASMNTARSFAPALFNGDWNMHWIYWVGPTIGALAGSGLYLTFFNPQVEKICDEEESHKLEPIVIQKQ